MGTVASAPDRRAIVTSRVSTRLSHATRARQRARPAANQRRHGEPSPFSGRRLAGEIRQLGWARPFALAFSAGIGRDFLWPWRNRAGAVRLRSDIECPPRTFLA